MKIVAACCRAIDSEDRENDLRKIQKMGMQESKLYLFFIHNPPYFLIGSFTSKAVLEREQAYDHQRLIIIGFLLAMFSIHTT